MEAIFIGSHFYNQSGSIMSTIYIRPPHRLRGVIKAYTRTDWGKVQIALANGEEVRITQASVIERLMFDKELERVKAEWPVGQAPR